MPSVPSFALFPASSSSSLPDQALKQSSWRALLSAGSLELASPRALRRLHLQSQASDPLLLRCVFASVCRCQFACGWGAGRGREVHCAALGRRMHHAKSASHPRSGASIPFAKCSCSGAGMWEDAGTLAEGNRALRAMHPSVYTSCMFGWYICITTDVAGLPITLAVQHAQSPGCERTNPVFAFAVHHGRVHRV